jgi:DNA-binding transcriptional ArsR family regulator
MELTSITPTPQMLRALAHPTRLRMLGLLRIEGPATATSLATRLGSNTGQTSYHLRQLAQHGFVVDDDERGNGRDRWWKAAHQSTVTGDMPERPEDKEALDAYMQTVAVIYTQQLQAAVEEMSLLPLPWREASTLSDYHVRLTAEHARDLTGRMHQLFMELREDADDDPDAVDFVYQLQAFPRPGHVAEVEER